MKRFVHHVAISTADLDRLECFYCDVLGFRRTETIEWTDDRNFDRIMNLENSAARVRLLEKDEIRLEVFEFVRPVGKRSDPRDACTPGYTHFCIGTEDIERDYRAFKEKGMLFFSEILEVGGDLCVYGTDPDGNIIELLEG